MRAGADFFDSVPPEDRAKAMVEISDLGEANFIAYDLFAINEDVLQSSQVFREDLLEHFSSDSTRPAFRLVLIDFMEDVQLTKTEARNFEMGIRTIAKNEKLPANLRAYAVSHLKLFPNKENKQVIRELLSHNDTEIVSGAGRACRAIMSDLNELERSDWANALVSALENHRSRIHELKSLISALGLTKVTTAKIYLQKLQSNSIGSGDNISHAVTFAMQSFPDSETFKNTFQLYSDNKSHFEDTYEVELVLQQVAINNPEILKSVAISTASEDKIVFLQALQALREPLSKEHIQKGLQLLNDADENVQMEAVKAVHFLLPYDEEVTVFSQMLETKIPDKVKAEIYSIIGRR